MWASEMVTGDRPSGCVSLCKSNKRSVQSLGVDFSCSSPWKAYSICLILAGTPFSRSVFCTCETLIRKDVSLPPPSCSGKCGSERHWSHRCSVVGTGTSLILVIQAIPAGCYSGQGSGALDCTGIKTPVSPQLMTTSHGTRVTPSSSDIGNHNLLRLPPQRPHLFQILWPAGPRSVTTMWVFCPQVPGFPMAQISHEGRTWVTTLCFTSHKTHTCPRAQSPGPQVLGRPRSHHHTPDHTCIGNLEQHLCFPVTSLSSCSGTNAQVTSSL